MIVETVIHDAQTGREEIKEVEETIVTPETPPEPTLEEKVQELQNNILNLQSVLISQKISGGGIKLTDSSGFPIRDFAMQGKTEQEENPSIESPKEIINAGADGEIEVKVTGKNLFDISKLKSGFDGVKIEDNKITLPIGGAIYFNSIKNICPDLKVGDEIYIFADSTSMNKNVYLYPQSGLILLGNKITIKSLDDQLLLYGDNSKISTITNLMFTKVNDKMYEQYKEPQTLTIPLDRSLTKWDRIEKRDGVYGIVYKHRIVEDFATLVKDSEPIYGNMGEKYFSVVLKDATLNYDYNKVYSEVGLYKKDVQKLYVPRVMASSFIVGVNDTDTIETAKTHLHYKVIYETDSEEFVPLQKETQTALNNLRTYYPTTVMSNSEDCEMEVEYVADTKNYVDKQIQAIVAKQINTDKLILERMM